MKTTQHTEMLGSAFRTRTDIRSYMMFAKDVTDCWLSFIVSYALLVWYINWFKDSIRVQKSMMYA
jgi:hypothetical protein